MLLTHHVTLFLLISVISTFRFTLDNQQPSLSLLFEASGTQTFKAVSSGEQSHQVLVLIQYTKLQMRQPQIMLNKSTNDIQFTHNYQAGTLNITIISQTSTPRNVSFDFYSQDDPLVKMIDKKDIKHVEQILTGIFKGLNDVSRNQQFHIQRDESHKSTLETSQSHIKWTGIIKIIFLLSSALIQLWIMKSFFKSDSHHSYQPVELH